MDTIRQSESGWTRMAKWWALEGLLKLQSLPLLTATYLRPNSHKRPSKPASYSKCHWCGNWGTGWVKRFIYRPPTRQVPVTSHQGLWLQSYSFRTLTVSPSAVKYHLPIKVTEWMNWLLAMLTNMHGTGEIKKLPWVCKSTNKLHFPGRYLTPQNMNSKKTHALWLFPELHHQKISLQPLCVNMFTEALLNTLQCCKWFLSTAVIEWVSKWGWVFALDYNIIIEKIVPTNVKYSRYRIEWNKTE